MGSIYADASGFRLPFTITNLGSLDYLSVPLTFRNLNIVEFFGGVSGISLVLLVYTINQMMHFHLHYMEPDIIESIAHGWVDNAMNLLRASIGELPKIK